MKMLCIGSSYGCCLRVHMRAVLLGNIITLTYIHVSAAALLGFMETKGCVKSAQQELSLLQEPRIARIALLDTLLCLDLQLATPALLGIPRFQALITASTSVLLGNMETI